MIVALGLLTSCGGGGDATDATDSSPSAPPSSSPDTTTPEPQLHRHGGPYDLELEQVRVRKHAEGNRVVLDFTGEGRPGWSVQYVDEAVLEGSGDVVDIDGDTILQISVFGTPTQPPADRKPVPVEVDGDVADVHTVGAYEGITTVFVGLDGDPAPFTVKSRGGPARMVVDIG